MDKNTTFFTKGWIMVAITFFMAITNQGFGLYSFSMLKVPMTETLMTEGTLVAMGFSAYTLATGLVSMIVGDIIEKRGLRFTLIIGAFLYSGGFLLLTFLTPGSLWLLYTAYAVMGSGSALGGAVVISGVPSNWFDKQRGIATGIVWCCMLPGSFIATNVVAAMTASASWQYAIYILAAISFVVTICAAFTLKWRPQEVGLLPDGVSYDPEKPSTGAQPAQAKKPVVGLSRRQAFGTASFWLLTVAFGLCGICEMGPFQNMPTFLVSGGNDLASVAAFMTFLSFAGIIGKLSAGFIIDRFNPRVAFVTVNSLCLIGLIMFFSGVSEGPLLYVAGFCFGAALSASLICFSTATAQYLGLKQYGRIWGLVYMMKPVSDAIGVPLLAGVAASSMGWPGSFAIAIVALIACTIAFAFAKKEKKLIALEKEVAAEISS